MINSISMPIIGRIVSPYVEKFGIPRQPNLVKIESFIVIESPYNDLLAFEGIQGFSHLWLIWQFHDNKQSHLSFRPQVRPPRLGGNAKIGVFATRSMYRPAALGLSVVEFDRIVKEGGELRLYVRGADLLDGTPIIDIKPYLHYVDAVPDATSSYAHQKPQQYEVIFEASLQTKLILWKAQNLINENLIEEIKAVLSYDPRPAYQQESDRVYKMKFRTLDIAFIVEANQIKIQDISLNESSKN